jgi:hypothetical protein
LKTFIEKTLPDVDNNSVVKKLEQLGVETIEDLKFLQESDLKWCFKTSTNKEIPVQCSSSR